MCHTGDEARNLSQSIDLSRFGLKRIGGRQGAVFERRPFGLGLGAYQLGDVGYATGRQCTHTLPQGCAVTAGLVFARRIAELTQCAPVYVTSVEHRLKG
jgi:hypothetical protein